jgi:hypothetical protein
MPAFPPTLVLAGAMLATAAPGAAQPRIWTVPGTSGATYRAVQWDAATGTILATEGHRVLRIDPVRGEPKVVVEKRWEAPRPGDTALGPELLSRDTKTDPRLASRIDPPGCC